MLEKVVVAGENKFMYRPTDNVGFLMYGEDNMRYAKNKFKIYLIQILKTQFNGTWDCTKESHQGK